MYGFNRFSSGKSFENFLKITVAADLLSGISPEPAQTFENKLQIRAQRPKVY